MKYRPSQRLCGWLAEVLAGFVPLFYRATQFDLIIPIPPSDRTIQRRAFHQSYILASKVRESMLGAPPISCRALHRAAKRTPQSSLDDERRFKAVKGLFTAGTATLTDRRILLVDDVVTTGATLTAAAVAIHQAGAKEIHTLSVARSPRWREYWAERERLAGTCE